MNMVSFFSFVQICIYLTGDSKTPTDTYSFFFKPVLKEEMKSKRGVVYVHDAHKSSRGMARDDDIKRPRNSPRVHCGRTTVAIEFFFPIVFLSKQTNQYCKPTPGYSAWVKIWRRAYIKTLIHTHTIGLHTVPAHIFKMCVILTLKEKKKKNYDKYTYSQLRRWILSSMTPSSPNIPGLQLII